VPETGRLTEATKGVDMPGQHTRTVFFFAISIVPREPRAKGPVSGRAFLMDRCFLGRTPRRWVYFIWERSRVERWPGASWFRWCRARRMAADTRPSLGGVESAETAPRFYKAGRGNGCCLKRVERGGERLTFEVGKPGGRTRRRPDKCGWFDQLNSTQSEVRSRSHAPTAFRHWMSLEIGRRSPLLSAAGRQYDGLGCPGSVTFPGSSCAQTSFPLFVSYCCSPAPW